MYQSDSLLQITSSKFLLEHQTGACLCSNIDYHVTISECNPNPKRLRHVPMFRSRVPGLEHRKYASMLFLGLFEYFRNLDFFFKFWF